MVSKIITLIFLAINSLLDVKYKKINLLTCFIFSICIVVSMCYFENYSIFQLIDGTFVGLFIIVIAVITKGSIGIGDGIVFIVIGLSSEIKNIINILFLSLLFLSIVSIILLILKRKNMKSQMPLVPFICASYILVNIASL